MEQFSIKLGPRPSGCQLGICRHSFEAYKFSLKISTAVPPNDLGYGPFDPNKTYNTKYYLCTKVLGDPRGLWRGNS